MTHDACLLVVLMFGGESFGLLQVSVTVVPTLSVLEAVAFGLFRHRTSPLPQGTCVLACNF